MHCTVIGPNLHTSKIVTAISVSERLLEMAAFYIPIYAAEGDSVMKLLTSGFSGNATTALAYILLGTFAMAIATTGLADIVSKKLSKIIGTTSRHDHPDCLPVSEPHPHSHRLYPHPDSSHARADEQDAPRPPRCGLLPCLRS